MPAARKCRRRGCTRRPDPESYYDRCHLHMWCAHCDVVEVRTGQICDTCRKYERRHGGERRHGDLVELQRRRLIEEE